MHSEASPPRSDATFLNTRHRRGVGGGFNNQNAQHKLAVDFTSQGVAVRGGNVFWKMAFCGYGYGSF
jgi:hypothetical protein